jgi:hypothetical protein
MSLVLFQRPRNKTAHPSVWPERAVEIENE